MESVPRVVGVRRQHKVAIRRLEADLVADLLSVTEEEVEETDAVCVKVEVKLDIRLKSFQEEVEFFRRARPVVS